MSHGPLGVAPFAVAAVVVLATVLAYPNVVELELLPYHQFGGSKYESQDREYEVQDLNPSGTPYIALPSSASGATPAV